MTRNDFSGNVIPADRIDPVARVLLERYPPPTSAGTALTIAGVGSMKASIRIRSKRPGRPPSARQPRPVVWPADSIPGGLRSRDATSGRQWSDPTGYARTRSTPVPGRSPPATSGSPRRNVVNELRIWRIRWRTVARFAAEFNGTPATSLGLPGIPSTARFPNTLPTFLIGGYQQLGLPVSTASAFGTSVTQVADSLPRRQGPPRCEGGADLRWERLNVIRARPPRIPASSRSSNLFTNLPTRCGNGQQHGDAPASFLLGQSAAVFYFFTCTQENPEPRQVSGGTSSRMTGGCPTGSPSTPGCATRSISRSTEENDQVAVSILEDEAARISWARRPAPRRAGAPQAQFRTTPRRRSPHEQHRGADRPRPRLDRDGWNNDSLHDASLPVPADGLAADTRQRHATVHARSRAERRSRFR